MPLDMRGSSGEERGSFFGLSTMVGWFELIINHIIFVKGEIFILCFIESSQLLS